MDAASIGCSKGTSSPMQSPRFEVTLAYQDLPTGLHARQFLNHVVDHCQLGADFNLTLWKLEMFHVPEICEQGIIAASNSELVILSLRGDIGLQAETEHWLRHWINRREEESALAVLIDSDMQRLDSVGQTLFRLQDLTRFSQVRLFVGFVPSAPAVPAANWKSESEHTETILAVRHDAPHPHAVREGGINE
jgi:hypothetical protein